MRTELETRVRRLERRSLILAMALAVVTLGTIVAARAPDQVADEVRARRILLVDAEDRVRMDLRHDDEETGLFIIDAEGDIRVGAAQFAHGGGGFALHGPRGEGGAVLYLRGDGSLTIYDEAGTVTARFPEEAR